MPTYTYRARTLDRVERSGIREASDVTALGHVLREEGLLLVEAHSDVEKSKKKRMEFEIPFMNRIKVADLMLVTRHLAVLIEAGVDLPRAITTVARQTKNPKFHDILKGLADEIRKGRKFSEILAGYPKVFSKLYISMVAAGEESGQLVETLRVLADQLKKQHKLKSSVRGAMMYPMVVLFAMIIIGIAMIIWVVPQLQSVFADLGDSLPVQTKVIFWLSGALISQWYLFVIGTIVFALVSVRVWKNKYFKMKRDAVLMRAPAFGTLIRQIASAKLARTLSSLVAAGVPIVRALRITANVVGNASFQRSLVDAADAVEKGTSLHESFSKHENVYPPLVIEMATVGEESGKLSEVFAELAEFYEEEVDQQLTSLSSIIEPVLMLVIGGIVGFFVISLMAPMYTLIGTI